MRVRMREVTLLTRVAAGGLRSWPCHRSEVEPSMPEILSSVRHTLTLTQTRREQTMQGRDSRAWRLTGDWWLLRRSSQRPKRQGNSESVPWSDLEAWAPRAEER